MGDRANFGFRQSNGDVIFLYGHWAGYGMMARLAQAIEVARPRWHDEPYATRIAISNIIGEEWNQEYSWGISTRIGDNEHSIPVVDWEFQTVALYPHDWTNGMDWDNPKFVMDLDGFINKFSKSLTYV
jgi:hypothetical protein